jgi:excinuclease ABC subunit B
VIARKGRFEYGFAAAAKQLKFAEFEKKIHQVVFVSATPAEYELKASKQVIEQIIRPTGLIDPEVIVRPIKGQIDDLIAEIKKRTSAANACLSQR